MSEKRPPAEEYKPMGQRMLAAIMFTDVAGFSRLMGDNEERTMKAMDRDLRLIKNLCEESKGRVLKLMGDGVLALFYSAVRAVECAREIQRQLAEHARTLPEDEVLHHRIGIHLGDVYVHENEVMGEGVNIAARLQTEAPPGGICISQALYEVVKRRLAIQTIHCGAKQLKNIKEEVHVYQILTGRGDAGYADGGSFPERASGTRRLSVWAAMATLLLIVSAIAYMSLRGQGSSPGRAEDGKHIAQSQRVESTTNGVSSQLSGPGERSETAAVEDARQATADARVETVYLQPETEAGHQGSPPTPDGAVQGPAGRGVDAGPRSLEEPHAPRSEPRAIFDRFDRNHDGELSWGELPPRVRPEIMRADKDRDGTVSWPELRDAARHRFGRPSAAPDSLPRTRESNDT